MTDPQTTTVYYEYARSFSSHFVDFLWGAAGIGVLAHAVNTFPMPKSAIGRWFLGVVQYAVGQRIQAANTLNGHESVMVPKRVLDQAKEVIANAPITSSEIVTVIPGRKD